LKGEEGPSLRCAFSSKGSLLRGGWNLGTHASLSCELQQHLSPRDRRRQILWKKKEGGEATGTANAHQDGWKMGEHRNQVTRHLGAFIQFKLRHEESRSMIERPTLIERRGEKPSIIACVEDERRGKSVPRNANNTSGHLRCAPKLRTGPATLYVSPIEESKKERERHQDIA